MISWIKSHLIWSFTVLLSAMAVILILADSFKFGVFVFAAAALLLAMARGLGTADRLLQVRSKRLDVLLYLGFATSLFLLALVIPTG
jgi:hypothetical protein